MNPLVRGDKRPACQPLSGRAVNRAACRHGCHATPAPVARFLCRQALTDYLASRFGDGSATGELAASVAERLREAVLACRVCDPAAGGGALLVAMLREMHALVDRLDGFLPPSSDSADLKRRIAASCLHGADIRPRAVELCRQRLEREAGAAVPELSRRIACGDSLLGDPFDHADRPAPFDIVIANPPYISFGLRGVQAARREWAAAVRARYPRSAEYKISTYAVFMDRCLSLTRPGGVCCCLTPDSYLLGRYFSKLRRRILEDCAVRALVLIEEHFWKGAVVGRPVVGVFRAGRRDGDSPQVTAARCPRVRDLARERYPSCSYRQAYFEGLPHNRFRLLFSEEDRRFVAAMEGGAARLGDVLSFASGMIGRRGRDAIVADAPRGPTWQRGIDSGADVLPYRVAYRGKYVNFDPAALRSGYRDARYDGPKLLLRQTADSLIAAYDPDGLYCLNNVHVGNARRPDVDVRLVVAILNSRLMDRYYRTISLETGRALAQTDIDVLEELPFKRPSPAAEREIVELVSRCQAESALPADTERLEVLVRRSYFPA
jgi:hypothetical protein